MCVLYDLVAGKQNNVVVERENFTTKFLIEVFWRIARAIDNNTYTSTIDGV